MGFQPLVPQQDTNWEIRAAVLASLVLQVFLIFIAPLRRRSASRFARFVVWSCYLLADWVADLCLGLLLNTLGNIGTPPPPSPPTPPPPRAAEAAAAAAAAAVTTPAAPSSSPSGPLPPPPPRRPRHHHRLLC
uniref:DUF4220 domain-containing protein n=1 Tax=Ananas comosus var. bracteatus TaxID=296719 RepID=A0A6V7QDA8_ANACO|nr:unnamed protein product [Ananas comosus var. bracteatus]